jgi:hypothetical protein
MKLPAVLNIHKKELLAAALLSLFFFILDVTHVIPLPALESRPLFSGYFTLVVRYTPGLPQLIRDLQAQEGIERVIAYETARVNFTGFDGLETVPLSELGARFDPEDPRLDPYLKGISAYFIQEKGPDEWRMVYIQTRLGAGQLSSLLTRLFKNAGAVWYLNENSAQPFAVVFALFNLLFIFMLLLLYKPTGYKILVLGGILPWLFSPALGNMAYFLLYLALCFYWSFLVLEFIPLCEQYIAYKWVDKDNRRFLLQSILWGALILLYLFARMYATEPVGDILMAAGADLLLLGLFTGVVFIGRIPARRRAYSHELFQPVPIVRGFKRRWYNMPGRTPVVIAVCCLFLAAPLLFLMAGHRVQLALPTPVRTGNSAINLKNMRDADREKHGNMLPDLTDYMKHVAFQQELEYGSPLYALPDRDETITLSTFEHTGNPAGIIKSEHVLERFDERWCAAVLAGVPESSVEKILLDQGSLVGVTLQTPKILGFDARQLWTIILLWCIFLCPLLLFNYFFTPRKLYGIKIPLTVKNKEY